MFLNKRHRHTTHALIFAGIFFVHFAERFYSFSIIQIITQRYYIAQQTNRFDLNPFIKSNSFGDLLIIFTRFIISKVIFCDLPGVENVFIFKWLKDQQIEEIFYAGWQGNIINMELRYTGIGLHKNVDLVYLYCQPANSNAYFFNFSDTIKWSC